MSVNTGIGMAVERLLCDECENEIEGECVEVCTSKPSWDCPGEWAHYHAECMYEPDFEAMREARSGR